VFLVRLMLGSNALALYDFDERALRGLADEIGPSPATVARAPVEHPTDYLGMGLR